MLRLCVVLASVTTLPLLALAACSSPAEPTGAPGDPGARSPDSPPASLTGVALALQSDLPLALVNDGRAALEVQLVHFVGALPRRTIPPAQLA